MFLSISWSQYITTLLVATVIYYFPVWVVVFNAKMMPALSNLRAISPHCEDVQD